MIETRCGLLCSECGYKESHNCGGCIETNGHPFHGECPVAVCCQNRGFVHCGECPDIPCEQLRQYCFDDKEHGDNGKRIWQCMKWAKKPEYPKFAVAFNIATNNEDRIAAFELYQKAFNAKKIGEGYPPDSNEIHISMEIGGCNFLLAPGSAMGNGLDNSIICEMHYDNENDLQIAYDVLIREGQNYSLEGPFPWAKLLALVTDKFGIGWALYYN